MTKRIKHWPYRKESFALATILLLVGILVISWGVSSGGKESNSIGPSSIHLLSNVVNNAAIGIETSRPSIGIDQSGFGWAMTNQGFMLTNDSGENWTAIALPFNGTSLLDAKSTSQGTWVVGTDGANESLYKLSPGGGSWISIELPPFVVPEGPSQIVTNESGELLGIEVTSVTSSNFSEGEWLGTTDGGTTWFAVQTPVAGQVNAINGVLYLVGGPTESELEVSFNLGATWNVASLPATLAGSSLSIAGTSIAGDVVLAATSPSNNGQSTFEVQMVSSNGSSNWVVGASVELPGSIGSGVSSPVIVSGSNLLIGDQAAAVVARIGADGNVTTGTLTSESGAYDSNLMMGNDGRIVAELNQSSCPSGKTSCSDGYGALMVSTSGGNQWSPETWNIVTSPTSS